MTIWRQYGLIWVSSGLIISGVGTLWYQRQRPDIRGEDVAELRAAVEERKLAYLTGTNGPISYVSGITTNWNVTTSVVTRVSLVKYDNGTDPYGCFSASPAQFVFRSSDFSSNRSFVCSDNWSSDNLNYKATYFAVQDGVTNDQVFLTLSRKSSGMTLHTGPAVSGIFLKYIGIEFGRSNSFNWVSNTISLTSYPTNASSIEVTTNGYTLATNIFASGRIDCFLRWDAIYKETLCRGRDMLVTNAVSPPCVLWLDPQLVSPANGDSIAENEGVWQTSTQTNAFPNPAFGPHITEWFMSPTPQSNSVDALPTTATRKNDGNFSIIPFLPDGVNYQATNYYSPRYPLATNNFPFGVLFFGAASTNLSSEWSGGNIWTRRELGTNVYKYKFETFGHDGTSDYLRTSFNITTQKLNEAKTVLQTMTRSMWIGDYNLVTVGTCTLWNAAAYLETNFTVSVTQEGQYPAPEDISESFISEGYGEFNSSWITNGLSVFSGDLLSLEITSDQNLNGQFWEYSNDDDWTTWNRYYSFTGNADAYALRGCRLPYPSEYACASGYVSKVTIFGVFASDTYPVPQPYANCYWGYTNTEYYGDGIYKMFETNTCGICDYLSPVSVPTTNLNFTIDHGVYMQAIDCLPFRIVLSKIAEFDNPAVRPVFDLGLETPTIDPDMTTIHYGSSMEDIVNSVLTITSTDEWWQKGKSQRLRLVKFVVVVDWKWKHLNNANPYSPTPYTPGWVTNNVVTNSL